ncbi:MAG: DNA-3-methyladenine glycosylase I [Gemmatimonadetes bacterium]|nr:DNA-3-methyladenine glycosylase I [Gemmatimonadota bacterium]
MRRCPWPGEDSLYVRYHDEEWGVPTRDDHALFEMLLLEGAQAGLAWITILRKREGYRRAFHRFDPARMAAMDDDDVERLVLDPSIVRHRQKIHAFIDNARAYLELGPEGAFSDLVWSFVGGEPRRNAWTAMEQVPATTPESAALSAELRRRGFRFVGPTTCYAFMQAAGLVDDHLVSCFRHGAAPQRHR